MDGIVGDAELVGILEPTASVGNDDAEAVVGDIGNQIGGRSPDEEPLVGNAFDNASNRQDVLCWAAQELDRDGRTNGSLRVDVSDCCCCSERVSKVLHPT